MTQDTTTGCPCNPQVQQQPCLACKEAEANLALLQRREAISKPRKKEHSGRFTLSVSLLLVLLSLLCLWVLRNWSLWTS